MTVRPHRKVRRRPVAVALCVLVGVALFGYLRERASWRPHTYGMGDLSSDQSPTRIALSSDGRTMVGFARLGPGMEYVLWVRDRETGTLQRLEGKLTPPLAADNPTAFALARDGRTAAVVMNGNLDFWDMKTQRRVASTPLPQMTIRNLQFSSDGEQLMVCSHHDVIWLSVPNGRVSKRLRVTTTGTLWQADLSRDGRRVAVTILYVYTDGSAASEFGVWDCASGRRLWQHQPDFEPILLSLCLTPDGTGLVVAGWDGSSAHLAIYDTATGRHGRTQKLARHNDLDLSFNRAGDQLVLWTRTTPKATYDIYSYPALHKERSFTGNNGTGPAHFWPDDRHLAAGDGDNKICIWRIE